MSIRHRNPTDGTIRRLERDLAADPTDDTTREALSRAQLRAGLRPAARKYLADLVLEMVRAGEVPGETRLFSTVVSRKGYAVGIRAVLKKAKLSKFVTVSVPNYSMANSVEINPTAAGEDPVARGRMDAKVTADVAAVFGVQESGSPQYISLHVWAHEDRSDTLSDYFAPGGPQLIEEFWEEFKAGVRRSFSGKRSNKHRRNSDAEIRSSERSVGDDPSDLNAHIGLLRKRLRAGLLSHEQLAYAAWLGHPAAIAAAETEPQWEDSDETYRQRMRAVIESLGNMRQIIWYAIDCVEHVRRLFPSQDGRPGEALYAAAMVADEEPRYDISNRAVARRAAACAREAYLDIGDPMSSQARSSLAASVTADVAHSDTIRIAASRAVDVTDLCASAAAAEVTNYGPTRLVPAPSALFDSEYLWQRERLAKYILGDVA